MNQEEKIEILKRQKKQIEEEIKRLKGVDLIEGRAKVSKDHYPTQKPDEWRVSIEQIFNIDKRYPAKERYSTIVRANRRSDLIEPIGKIIKDLSSLKSKLEREVSHEE